MCKTTVSPCMMHGPRAAHVLDWLGTSGLTAVMWSCSRAALSRANPSPICEWARRETGSSRGGGGSHGVLLGRRVAREQFPAVALPRVLARTQTLGRSRDPVKESCSEDPRDPSTSCQTHSPLPCAGRGDVTTAAMVPATLESGVGVAGRLRRVSPAGYRGGSSVGRATAF